jgi:1-acyl-sn-glycerol-3-phosphate acyltransferase
VAIEASGLVLPANAWTFRPGTIRVKVGQPISTEGRSEGDREALAREVREAIICLHREIGGQGGDSVAIAPRQGSSGDKTRQVA